MKRHSFLDGQKKMKTSHHIRFITAASLFDGHDAAIHIMRRVLQSEGAEVIHLGHNRSVYSVVKAAVEEDAQGIAISSYQGGHVEYFTYMLELLREFDASSIKIFGGGGGVITPDEIKLLEQRGIQKIFSPDDGFRLGLVGMIQHMLKSCDNCASNPSNELVTDAKKIRQISAIISTLELSAENQSPASYKSARERLLHDVAGSKKHGVVVGITGTGGAGKSSLIDELLLRFLKAYPQKRVAILSVDPTRMKTGGALLGDRIRMNQAESDRVFVRSMATRSANTAISETTKDVLSYLSVCDFDMVILETAGIGQSDQYLENLCDVSIYVMTPEYGAPSQLEKIAMLDAADMVAINKFDKPQSLDSLRDVQKAYQRNHQRFDCDPTNMPVFPTCAHIFQDRGCNALFNFLMKKVHEFTNDESWIHEELPEGHPNIHPLIPQKRIHYLSEVAETVRAHHKTMVEQAEIFGRMEALENSIAQLEKNNSETVGTLSRMVEQLNESVDPAIKKDVQEFFHRQNEYSHDDISYEVRGKKIPVHNNHISLSHVKIPKVKAPNITSKKAAVLFVGKENLPGYFPFTAGVFPFKRPDEDPTRMFAGEGGPERTNKRFHFVSHDHQAKRLSTAFDSVTLYGENPSLRPDIYGKIGNAGVSVCSLDDMKRLYSGFDLTHEKTSVSMTINGPAPTMLAYFFNAAIDFEVEKELKKLGHYDATKKAIDDWFRKRNIAKPQYRASKLPDGHDGSGLLFLGLPSDHIVSKDLYQSMKERVQKNIRGTIQADILKEDQAQNTCIFSTEFSLRMMGDVEEYFIKNAIHNFYSVSISGYHIAEAGANPISQLAFTLANGFTLLEYYRARGMRIDDFARNFSFFFSNGVDPEYSVIGRVARRIWAIALKKLYGADERSQKLKYHIQTSGRSLHAQEMSFNDIRTTLQALYAIADNCNSLHTNAFDEAITTPTESSVRRAVAIQMIINRELGLTKNENPWQGSYFFEYLTDTVEEAVLNVFDKLDVRGGVLGAMETMYQRGVIQEESLYYEQKKLTGELPIVGVNTFLEKAPSHQEESYELMRSTDEEKRMQTEQVLTYLERFQEERCLTLQRLKDTAISGGNVFSDLMEAAKYATIGEISQAFFEVGGAYRRAM